MRAAALVLVAALSWGAAGIAGAQVVPTAPTTKSVVKVKAEFGSVAGCGVKMKITRRKAKSGVTTIRVSRQGEGMCDGWFEGGEETVSLGKLAAGRYLIEAGGKRFEVVVKPAK